ncbi:translocation/assembly module TamB domain-containing protein [Xylophilus sp. ASV27]|uniref:translocation/assembly module TamB domain-containing protein n=1 Tax=Xylophilus sp. ASV27 TaxID=2795129 RepID=UPI0018EC4AE1|nr:translocation/assembly module TamB domain-containing protein [Xylophilus sp. ASV27]
MAAPSHDDIAAARHDTPRPAASPPPPPRWRLARWAAAAVATLLLLSALLLGAAWIWAGSSQSLATVLAQVAQRMPAGQALETREVSGSVRAGGHIGWLRWQSPTLAVEVHDARIGWQLRPLLKKRLQLGELHAAQIAIERLGPGDDSPTEPLEQLTLPLEVDLPFRVDDLRWAGPPLLQATQLAGRYRYEHGEHRLAIDGVDLPGGHYQASATLQGAAPMALDGSLSARLRAPVPGSDAALDVLGDAGVRGTLATAAARLELRATLRQAGDPAPNGTSADLQAVVAPWQTQPVVQADARFDFLDLAQLWPQAPSTQLHGTLSATPQGNGLRASAELENRTPGPWDRQRLPLQDLAAQALLQDGRWTLSDTKLHAGGGEITLEGSFTPAASAPAAPAEWQARTTLRGVRPGDLHTRLQGPALSGKASAETRGEAIGFDVQLQAQAGGRPSPGGLDGLHLRGAAAQGQWANAALDLRSLRVQTAEASLQGQLRIDTAAPAGEGQLALALPGAQGKAQGRMAAASGAGTLALQVADAARLQRWVAGLPGLPAALAELRLAGKAQLDARWQGGWQSVQQRLKGMRAKGPELTLQARLDAPSFNLTLPAAGEGAATAIALRGLHAELGGSLEQATLSLQGEASSGTRRAQWSTQASGGMDGPGRGRLAIARLQIEARDSQLPGPWTLTMEEPLSATLRSDAQGMTVQTSAGQARLRGPVDGSVRLAWEPMRYRQAGNAHQLQSKGRLEGLPMAWAQALADGQDTLGQLGLSGDLVFDGDWDIDASDTLRARASLMRRSGDIRVLAEDAPSTTHVSSSGSGTTQRSEAAQPTTSAGLREARLALMADGNAVRAELAWDSERAGKVMASASTRLQRQDGGWSWPEDAPLEGRLQARLPSIGAWSMLAPPGWRVQGTLQADATLAGRRNEPQWTGTLAADDLSLRSAVDGIELRDGRLRSTLRGTQLEITEFSLRGGTGSNTRISGIGGSRATASSLSTADGGSLMLRGTLGWAGAAGLALDLKATAQALRVSVRSDRQVTLSGDLQARTDDGRLVLRGDLRTDRAAIILPDDTAPQLGSDVVVRSAARDREAAAKAERIERASRKVATAKPPDIAVSFDLGNDFAVQGRGITTRLTGKLDIRSSAGLDRPPLITGDIRTDQGRYRAYGQQLDVESGVIRFNGPYDNPSLDILAIRPNIAVRAGVQVTGTAQSPSVRLYSDPALTDAETLSWVVLGRSAANGGAEAALLQQAALALLSGGKGSSGNIAAKVGLDEIGFKGPGSGTDASAAALTFGKRISQKIYVTYERSLSGTFGTLYIFYDLSRRLQLRGQTGTKSALDLIYTITYN